MKIYLDAIIKSIKSQTNNKSSGNDRLTVEFCKGFSIELAPVLLDVCKLWGKHGTMGVTSRIGVISVICTKGDKKILETTEPYTAILKNRLQKILDTIIGENQSAAFKKIEQFYVLFLLFVTIDVLNKLNKSL